VEVDFRENNFGKMFKNEMIDCKGCSFAFANNGSLNEHLARIERVSCLTCSKTFLNGCSMKAHVKNYHNSRKASLGKRKLVQETHEEVSHSFSEEAPNSFSRSSMRNDKNNEINDDGAVSIEESYLTVEMKIGETTGTQKKSADVVPHFQKIHQTLCTHLDLFLACMSANLAKKRFPQGLS